MDLTTATENRRRKRAAALCQAPDGARVVLKVGELYVDFDVLGVLRGHVERLSFDVQGDDPLAVRKWVTALRTGRVPETGWCA